MKTHKATIALISLLTVIGVQTAQADVIWTGGGVGNDWTTPANWDTGVPGTGDTVIINNGDTVSMDLSGGNLPLDINLTLSGNSTLGSPGVLRTSGGTYTIEAGSTLGSGEFLDMNDGTFTFKDGALTNISSWEQKDINVFNFELGAGGFSALAGGNFSIGNGSLPGDIANATYNVDMAAYTGGVGAITLVQFSGGSMNDATFQGAGGLNVNNAGSYTANLQWNNTAAAIELNVTSAIPEPSTFGLLGLGAVLGLAAIRRRVAS